MAELNVERARALGVCRICTKDIYLPYDSEYPEKFEKYAGRTVNDVTLDYGEEFAHTDCLITKTEKELKKIDY